MTEQLNPTTETVQPQYSRAQLQAFLAFELSEADAQNERAAQELVGYPDPGDDSWLAIPAAVTRNAQTALETGTDAELIAAASAIRQAVIAAVHRRLTAAGLMH